jgi:response regulator RpfG family c-di-GMP phosphodiesterase
MLASKRLRSTESKFRLLYLGNDLELIAAMRRVLAESDYRLVACADRESCILFLKSDIQYHLLLIDLEWQGTEGLELVRLAHSLRHRKSMPTILVTAAKLSRHMSALARDAGVDECLIKTKDMSGLAKAVTRLLETN